MLKDNKSTIRPHANKDWACACALVLLGAGVHHELER